MKTVERPDNDQLIDIFREMRSIIDDLEKGALIELEGDDGRKVSRRSPSVGQFLGLAAAAMRDGFPTSSMQGGGGPSTTLDEEGHAIPPLSDPTGELAISDKIVDPIKIHAQTTLRGLTGALGDLRVARGSLIRGSRYAKLSPGKPACVSHARIGRFVDTYRDERCNWCYRFRLAEKGDPPVDLLEVKDRVGKVTTRQVKESLQAERDAQMPARKKTTKAGGRQCATPTRKDA